MPRIVGDFTKTFTSHPSTHPTRPTPNPVKTLGYSCLDIVKPHFQHRHYVKHVAETDKSDNGSRFGGGIDGEGGREGVGDRTGSGEGGGEG